MSSGQRRDQLNAWCRANGIHIECLAIGQQVPSLVDAGDYPVPAGVRARAAEIARGLRMDEWHALVDVSRPQIAQTLDYQVLRYSEMLALREAGLYPAGLAATVLVCDRAQAQLLWQKRSASSHLFPGCLSLLGGGFNPERAGVLEHDHNDLRRTAVREAREEAALSLALPEDAWVSMTRETNTGAVQINFLGIAADFATAQADEVEGELCVAPVPDLDAVADLSGFTDLAKAALYAWGLCR